MKKSLIILLGFGLSLQAAAQTNIEEMAATPGKFGGVYYAYPVTESQNTPAPKGYEPFYISHYGRHGSRYLISDVDYLRVFEPMQKAHEAGKLTPLGEDAFERVQLACTEAEGRGGELTPLGARQHKGIARRMYAAFPETFAGNPVITANSTQVMRCAHSMFNFVEALKELNPSLEIPMESSKRHMIYLCHSEPESWKFNDNEGRYTWRQEYDKFKADKTNSDRFVSALFNDPVYILRDVDPDALMEAFYWLACDMQNMETPVSFFDLFTNEELFDLWQIHNASFYIHNASYPRSEGLNVDNAKNLLRNIIETADSYIAEGKNGATLRFGHDGNIVPLAALMQFDGCHGYENDPYKFYEVWDNFKISPMASNMQMVFFRNPQGDIIVKFMMNERETHIPAPTDMYPFYRWDDARAALIHLLETPSKEFIPADRRPDAQ